MARRRKAVPVTLSSEQRARLERLWFVYGNYGPKTTPGNHSFIQGLLEQGLDLRPLITKRSRKSEIPTPECEAAVDEVLAQKYAGEGGEGAGDRVRVWSGTTTRESPSADAESGAAPDDTEGRRRGGDGNKAPDSA